MSITRTKKLIAGAVVGLGLLGAAGTASAATSASVNNCTVSVNPVYVQYRGGSRGVEANVYVKCSVGRSGIVNAQMMENDGALGDDPITSLRSGSFTILAGQTQKVLTVWGACNDYDPVGSEEVYLKARINVGGINSSWAQTADLSTTC